MRRSIFLLAFLVLAVGGARYNNSPRSVAEPAQYVALLNQSNTDAPNASVRKNSLGGTVIWTRNDVGVYFGTLAGAFGNTSVCFVTHGATQGDFDFTAGCVAQGDTITLYTYNTTLPAVDGFENLSLEVRVYPEP